MKAHDTRPGGVAVDPGMKATRPGVTPRPPTADDEGTVPRRILEIARAPVSDPLPSEPLLGAALTASLGSMGDTTPDGPRREMPSASQLLAACEPTPEAPEADAGIEELAVAAKVTPMIPERADSDGARNARFATEGAPARASNVTMPTGEVLVDPTAQDPRVEVNLEALGESRPRRVALPTVPSGHVLEREERKAYIWRTKQGLAAGISIALVLLAVVMLAAFGVADPKKPGGGAETPVAAPQAAKSVVVAPLPSTPAARVVSPLPPATVVSTAVTAGPKGPHGPTHGPKAAVTTAAPTAPAVPLTPPVATVPVPASSVPDITHNIH